MNGRLLLLALAAAQLHATATISGTVFEKQSGHPLARVAITAQLVGGNASDARTVRSNPNGIFQLKVPPGAYIITASKLAFAPVQYGQKRWRAAGVPLVLEENDAASISIRMPRYGSIVGTLYDENQVALPEHDVAVYTTARPPRMVSHVRTDDRGMYRLYGLPPGNYLVRSLAKMYDEDGYVPTFYRDAATVAEARPVTVGLDQQVEGFDLHPIPGRLFNITGRVFAGFSVTTTVTLSADTGTETAGSGNDGFNFPRNAPGNYELFAQFAGDRTHPAMAAFQAFILDHDTDIRIALAPLPTIQFQAEDAGGKTVDTRTLRVMVRRKELTGAEKPEMNADYRPDGSKAIFLPGRWEVALSPTNAWYAAQVVTPGGAIPPGRADGWNEIMVSAGAPAVVKFILSAETAAITGVVRSAAGVPVAGIPVFLEPFDLEPRKRLADFVSAVTNPKGQYQFNGLSPGIYRLLATHEYSDPIPGDLDSAGVIPLRVEAGPKTVADLQEYVIH